MRSLHFIAVLTIVLLGCGGGTDSPSSDSGVRGDAEPGQPDSSVPEGYEELITGNWTKAPGSDSYQCVWMTLDEDVYINSFAAIAPLGTHHTVLSVIENPTSAEGQGPCNTNSVGQQLLYASGVGTEPLEFPEGVAIKLEAGTTIHLQLHLFNASDNEIAGNSGISIRTMAPQDVVHEAEFFFAGTVEFYILGNGQDYTASGTCAVEADGTLIALWPHMHLVGKHMKVTLEGDTLHDASYSFDEQKFYPLETLPVSAGDEIGVTCTWNNPDGDAPRSFGNGDSEDEMCFSGFYRYPKVNSDPFCGLLEL